MTLAVAESCTGGYLAHRITNVPGASTVFLGGCVTYSNEAKTAMLGVDAGLITTHGAVSKQVAQAMAEGMRANSNCGFALATTGIAGPTGGSSEKPLGTVFIALAARDRPVSVQKRFFPDDRPTFKELTTQAALEMLRSRLI
jgi:nicotinamide-nucleotide amidase